MKVVVFPKNLTNPYQDLLYGALTRDGVEVAYLAAATPSQTLNLALLPGSLAWHRARGSRVLHLHWVYLFAPVWVRFVPYGRSVMQAWFGLFLKVARLLGYRVVWTAHNLLPHQPVFADDAAARRLLARSADVVIAHGPGVVTTLQEIGAREVRVIPAGSYVGRYPQGMSREAARQRLGIGEGERVVVFLGAIEEYKGVDRLLEATVLAGEPQLRVVVAGSCRDPELRHRLASLAGEAGPAVLARLAYVPDDELQCYFAAADVATFPYLRVTNASSVLLAFSFGVPALVPDLPELADLPEAATIRYEQGTAGLARALGGIARMEASQLASLAASARAFAGSLSWEEAARSTLETYVPAP